MRDWSEFDKFRERYDEYLPPEGEGENMATQATTAVCKLVYKWFNDGDVYDTTVRDGWCNNLSSYANWLDNHLPVGRTLSKIFDTSYDYEDILYELCTLVFRKSVLQELETHKKCGSIYNCEGRFHWEDNFDDEDDWY